MQTKLGLIGIGALILILAGCTDHVEVAYMQCQLGNCGHATENPTCSREPYENCPAISYYEDACTKFLHCNISTTTGCPIQIIEPEYSSCYDCFKTCESMATLDEQLDCNEQCTKAANIENELPAKSDGYPIDILE